MGDLKLRRVDYAQVGTTSRGCLKVLCSTAICRLLQVVAGAHNGTLFSFGRKKNETQVIFKTLPGAKIDCLALGGAMGTPQDKIFIATGATIKGYSRKGRQFFTFETDLAEKINVVFIAGVDMFLCGTYTFNHYHDCKTFSYFLCGDKINDVLCLPVSEGNWVGRGITPILACDDRTLKVLEQSRLCYELPLGGQPTVLKLYPSAGNDSTTVLYGTRDGKVGLANLPQANPSILWEVSSVSGESGVCCLDLYDMTNDGIYDLIVGRECGSVEVHCFDANEQPRLKTSFQCAESVTSVTCGRIASPYFDEIVVCTYSGWIFGLTTEPSQQSIGSSDIVSQPKINPGTEEKIRGLRLEMEELQNRVAIERDRYQQNTTKEGGVSAVPVFAAHDSFTLNKQEAAYILSVELQVPIDYVMLQSDVPIDLLDLEKNSAVVSLTPCSNKSENALLATYRCQANTTRIEIKIRSIEGQYGRMRAYIAPRLHPKACQMRQYYIKPLSLHQRTHAFDESRPHSVIKLAGNFTLAEAHAWVSFCLPELPDKPPVTSPAVYHFTSTFTGAQLECIYQKNSATFRSDCISTIAILKDVLSKESTKKKIRLDINCNVDDESVNHILKLIHPKLEYQLNLAKKIRLIEALRELSAHDEKDFLSQEYMDILNNADSLQAEFKKHEAHLERIYGIITDLYIDKFKFKGQSVKHKVPELLKALDSYSLESLIAFFAG